MISLFLMCFNTCQSNFGVTAGSIFRIMITRCNLFAFAWNEVWVSYIWTEWINLLDFSYCQKIPHLTNALFSHVWGAFAKIWSPQLWAVFNHCFFSRNRWTWVPQTGRGDSNTYRPKPWSQSSRDTDSHKDSRHASMHTPIMVCICKRVPHTHMLENMTARGGAPVFVAFGWTTWKSQKKKKKNCSIA